MISESVAHKIIHGFAVAAVAHAGTTDFINVTAQSSFAGTAALTAETIAMVTLIVKKCGASWTQAAIESFVAQQLAQHVGVTAASEIIKYIPLRGNAFRAATTFGIIEAIGWATYEACRTQLAQNQ